MLGAVVLLVSGALPVAAATTTEVTTPTEELVYLELQAMIQYLTAVLHKFEQGTTGPVVPTFVLGIGSGSVAVSGRVNLPADVMTVCGPMTWGSIDWGDGTSDDIRALGCSGSTHAFTMIHEYGAAGRYKVSVTDNQNQVTTKSVSLRTGAGE